MESFLGHFLIALLPAFAHAIPATARLSPLPSPHGQSPPARPHSSAPGGAPGPSLVEGSLPSSLEALLLCLHQLVAEVSFLPH